MSVIPLLRKKLSKKYANLTGDAFFANKRLKTIRGIFSK
jgi:hypothetical protein